ncbi:MAG: toll/interleukin-1 receptor domain-containing protein [Clostridia bacterium]|nr:toll/interleukin-1 receptor domain-containing protein [Clostridia bacterium]
MPNLPNIKAYDGQGKYIFVSYSHKEKEAVYPFIAALQEKYNVWFDEGIHYGHEWEDEIAEKLDGCSIFIYMISNTSLESDNCKDELHLARSQKKEFHERQFV